MTYTRQAIENLMRNYPRFVQPSRNDQTGVPGAGDSGRLPKREDVLVQRQRSHCAPFEGTSVMYADLESALRTLAPWRVAIALDVAVHGFGSKVRKRQMEAWDMGYEEVTVIVNDVVESVYQRLNGLSVATSVGSGRP